MPWQRAAAGVAAPEDAIERTGDGKRDDGCNDEATATASVMMARLFDEDLRIRRRSVAHFWLFGKQAPGHRFRFPIRRRGSAFGALP